MIVAWDMLTVLESGKGRRWVEIWLCSRSDLYRCRFSRLVYSDRCVETFTLCCWLSSLSREDDFDCDNIQTFFFSTVMKCFTIEDSLESNVWSLFSFKNAASEWDWAASVLVFQKVSLSRIHHCNHLSCNRLCPRPDIYSHVERAWKIHCK